MNTHRNTIRNLALLAVLVVGARQRATLAQTRPDAAGAIHAATPDLVDRVRFERLESGLRVCVVTEPDQPLVSVQLWFAAGSAAEPSDEHGVAEELRRVREARRDAALRVRATGAGFEGCVLRDATMFDALAPVEHLDALLPIFAELAEPLASSDLDNVGRGVAANEAAGRRDAVRGFVCAHANRDVCCAEREGFGPPEDAAAWPLPTRGGIGVSRASWERILGAMFPGHPYGHATVPSTRTDAVGHGPHASPGADAVGQREPPSSASDRAAARRDFDARWLVAGNATLFIIGGVEREATLGRARDAFARLAWREPARRAFVDRPVAATIHFDDADLPAGSVVLTFLTPAWGYAENATLEVLMHRLCNPVDGVLAQRLRPYGAPPPRWQRWAWRDAGVLVISLRSSVAGADAALESAAATQPASATDLAALVDECLKHVADQPTGEVELRRARALAACDVRAARARFRDYAWRLAAHEIVGGDLLQADFEPAHVARVTVGDLRAAAERLAETRRVVVTGATRAERRSSAASTNATASVAIDSVTPRPARSGLSPIETLRRLSQARATAPDSAPPTGAALPVFAPPPIDICSASERGWMFHGAASPRASVGGVAVELAGVSPATAALVPALGSLGRSSTELLDYFTAHGLSWRVWPVVGGSVAAIDGPPERIAQMTEWLAELVAGSKREADALLAAERDVRRAALARDESSAAVADRLVCGWVGARAAGAGVERMRTELQRVADSARNGAELLVAGAGRATDVVEALVEVWRDPLFDGFPMDVQRAGDFVDAAPNGGPKTTAAQGASEAADVGDVWLRPNAAERERAPVWWAPRAGESAELRVVVVRRRSERGDQLAVAWPLLLGWPADLPGEIEPGVSPRWRVERCDARGAILSTRVAAHEVGRELADIRAHVQWMNTPGDGRSTLAAVANALARVHGVLAADGPRGLLRRMLDESGDRRPAPSHSAEAAEFAVRGVVVVGGEAAPVLLPGEWGGLVVLPEE